MTALSEAADLAEAHLQALAGEVAQALSEGTDPAAVAAVVPSGLIRKLDDALRRRLPYPFDAEETYGGWRRTADSIRRRAARTRDGDRCRACGSDEHLEVHHLKPERLRGDDRLENLVTLCRTCHRKTERMTRELT